jgi:hypothetical protein
MFYKNSILAGMLVLGFFPALAQNPTAISLVESGVTAYLKGDATAALKAWIKGSSIEGNQEALSQANLFRQIEDLYGKPQGYDLISEVPLTEKVKIVYFVLNMQRGAVFCRFQVYKTPQGNWISGRFDFHTEASKILPTTLMEPH